MQNACQGLQAGLEAGQHLLVLVELLLWAFWPVWVWRFLDTQPLQLHQQDRAQADTGQP